MALFTVFSVVSAFSGFIGYSDCGCFGPIKVNPWVTFALDLTALALLFSVRPQFFTVRPIASFALLAGAAILVSMGIVLAGSPVGDHLLAFFRGNKVYIVPAVSDFGCGPQGTTKTLRVNIINRSDSPVRIVGGTANCSCTILKDLPILLQGNGQIEVEIEVMLKGQPGLFDIKYQIFTDLKKDEKITGVVNGRISVANPP